MPISRQRREMTSRVSAVEGKTTHLVYETLRSIWKDAFIPRYCAFGSMCAFVKSGHVRKICFLPNLGMTECSEVDGDGF